MDIKARNKQIRLPMNEAIEVDVTDDETRRATARILENPLQVLGDTNTGSSRSVEDRKLLPLLGRRRCQLLVSCHKTVQNRSQHGQHFRRLCSLGAAALITVAPDTAQPRRLLRLILDPHAPRPPLYSIILPGGLWHRLKWHEDRKGNDSELPERDMYLHRDCLSFHC